MLPIGDDDSYRRSAPIVTFALVAINICVFLFQISHGAAGFEQFVKAYGMVPFEISHGQDVGVPGPAPIYLTLLTSMFMHANWMHLGGNMLFLWIFGDNVEDTLGKGRFIAFYLLCGLAASFAEILLSPGSTIPGLGASGAIAGVLGAYLILFPQQRIRTLTRYGVGEVPASMMLGFWILTQVLAGIGQWGGHQLGGVAYSAHIGGFVAGIVLIKLLAPATSAPRRAVI
jgi:membrane associated rhomboid family serine protease